MNPTVFAMKRPITTLMLVLTLVSAGYLGYTKMKVDIFPALNVPQVYVFLNYVGMSPEQMEGFIVNQQELWFQYVDGIKDIDSRNIQQVSLCRLKFHPGTNMGQAMAQVVAMSQRAMSWMPKGTLPPMIMRMDAGSVPVGYLVLESKDPSVTPVKMCDWAQNLIRPQIQKRVPGTVAISPFGPNMRSIIVKIKDSHVLQKYNLTPPEIASALSAGNVVIPEGNVYILDTMPIVKNNGIPVNSQDLKKIPVKLGENVYLEDVADIEDAPDIYYGNALVNGRKSVYLPIIKTDTGSTLKVVADVHAAMKYFKGVIPKEYWKEGNPEHRDKLEIRFEFDESPTVLAAVESVATEGLIGAGLTGLMILIFLRDPRSVIVVVANIPLALLGSLFGLWLTGNTINIMSLGGMALAIGILVDEATVTIENVHVQMGHTNNVATAVLHASNATAVPRLLALLCILSVFIPAFIMDDPLRSLFMPLTLGVGFAMITSYILSSTFVPVLCVYLLKPMGGHAEAKGGMFDLLLNGYGKVVRWFVELRWIVVPAYLAGCAAIILGLGMMVGTELFPQIDSGQFVLRFRPPPGSSYELTREMGMKCLEQIENEAGEGNVEFSLGYVGQVAPNFGINNMVLFMRGPDDGQLRVKLRDGSGIRLPKLREKLREVLPERIIPWLALRLQQGGLPSNEAQKRAQMATFGFEPGDIVSSVMSFGSMTPIGVRVVGNNLPDVRKHAELIRAEMKKIPSLRDVLFEQTLDYPSIEIEIDRQKAGLIGVTVEDLRKPLVMATSSTRFTDLNYWTDVKTGFDYLVEVLVPPNKMVDLSDIERLPIKKNNANVNVNLRDVATVRWGVRPGEFDRNMSQRYLTVTANVEGEDMGRAAAQVSEAIKTANLKATLPAYEARVQAAKAAGTQIDEKAPDGTQSPEGIVVDQMGQLPPMREMFTSLSIGLGVAVFVILVLLTAYFQSFSLGLISIGSVPGVIAGIAAILYFTNTGLNIESFMGSIMCLGVSVSNSVMLVTFMDEHWKQGRPGVHAAIVGAGERLRPVLMTACAMVVGMVPMALALEKGSEMQAPLGLAVIGGLVMSTVATLLVVPSIFAIVIGKKVARSPSMYPDDRDSKYYDPDVYADLHKDESGNDLAAKVIHHHGEPNHRTDVEPAHPHPSHPPAAHPHPSGPSVPPDAVEPGPPPATGSNPETGPHPPGPQDPGDPGLPR